MRKLAAAALPALGMLLLIIDSKTALRGALDGITMCLQTVIPALFPFFILSILLSTSLLGIHLPMLKLVNRICRCPEGSEGLFLTGILGGYPTGAQAVDLAFERGSVAKADAIRMLGFCSNAGPAFLFGIVAVKFDSPMVAAILWIIHIFSAMATGFLLPGTCTGTRVQLCHQSMSISDAVDRSVKIMARVCGWIILFRIIIAFLEHWFLWLLPTTLQIIISGLLELTNGCCRLHEIESDVLRMIVASILLNLGGLCVAMQTASVTHHVGLGMYFPGKILQSLISIIITALLGTIIYGLEKQHLALLLSACILGIGMMLILLKKRENRCSIPTAIRV